MLITAVVIFVVVMVMWAGRRKLMGQVEGHVADILGVVAQVALVIGLMLAGLLIMLPQYMFGADNNGLFLQLSGGLPK